MLQGTVCCFLLIRCGLEFLPKYACEVYFHSSAPWGLPPHHHVLLQHGHLA